MQPCQVCGGMGVDVNGYCTQCGNYRGVPQPAPPSSGAPYGGYPTSAPPQSAPPYGGYPPSAPPQSAPPFGGYPTNAPPQSASPAGGYPTVYPPTTYGGQYGAPTSVPQKRGSWTVPLIAASGILVVLIVAIVVVVVARGGKDTTTTPITDAKNGNSAAPGTSKSASLVDDCVIGTWQMTSYTETLAVPNVGPVPFKLSGTGSTVKFGADGKGVEDYGTGTNYTGNVSASGQTVKVNLKVDGQIKFDFRTNDNTISYSHLDSNSKITVSAAATGFSETDDNPGSSDPSKYTCSGDKMTMSTTNYSSEMKRLNKSG